MTPPNTKSSRSWCCRRRACCSRTGPPERLAIPSAGTFRERSSTGTTRRRGTRPVDRERFEHRAVTIQPPHPWPSESWAMHQHYNAAGVRPSSLGGVPGPPAIVALHIVGAARRLLHKVNGLRRVLLEWRADVIDAHLEPAALVSVLAAAASRTPTAVTLYSPVPLTPPPLWPVVGHLVMGMASVIVTDSEARRQDIRRWMRRPQRPVLVVPNGILPPQTARPADETRAQLGIPRDPGIRVIGQVA